MPYRILEADTTCTPWPQCQDNEPPKPPLDSLMSDVYYIRNMNHAAKVYEYRGAGELEVQALVYCGLTAMGYRVRGEVPSGIAFPEKTVMWTRRGRRVEKFARFDLVVFGKDWQPLRIIETKHSGYSIDFENSRQNARYSQYGVPVDFAMNFGTAGRLLDSYAERLPSYIQEHGIVTDRESVYRIIAKCMAVKGTVNV